MYIYDLCLINHFHWFYFQAYILTLTKKQIIAYTTIISAHMRLIPSVKLTTLNNFLLL